ncbi:protein of unknown function DUF3447 - like 10 [Theobroma cacao]|nr:protein of unknown function DUF3447 - like 10 [Theobroma cacao]
MEIMILKPSLAKKLNQEGFSPIHLAVEKGHTELAVRLMQNDKSLVRVKGRKGETPLHYAITKEQNLDLLARFLEACPECIRDMTTTNQTALHIATKTTMQQKLHSLNPWCDGCEEDVIKMPNSGKNESSTGRTSKATLFCTLQPWKTNQSKTSGKVS